MNKSPGWRIGLGLMLGSLLFSLHSVSGQGVLTNGAAHDGAIGAAGETDLWTLSANKGDRIISQLAELSGGASFNPRLEILGPDGTSLGVFSDAVAARLDIQAYAAGTYTVAVRDLNATGTGTYRLQLAQVPGSLTVQAGDQGGPLTNGQNHVGTIDQGDLDSWTLTANAGDHFSVQLGELTGGAGFTPLLEVFGPDGSRLGFQSGATGARLNIHAGVAGTYTVVVSDLNRTGTGTYRIQLAQVPGSFVVPAGDEGGALVNGTNQIGVIDAGDMDLWTFTANAGDRIVLQASEVSGGPSFFPTIELFAPDGTQLGLQSGAVAARLDVQARASGTYTVLVSDQTPAGAGTYQLQLAQTPGSFVVPSGDEGGPLPNTVNTDGSIPVGDLDLWTFSATPGERITLQITELSGGANFAPQLEVFGPNGELKGSTNNAIAALLDMAIETAGTYTVLVSDANQVGSGTYRLNLNRSSIAPAGPNVLVNGANNEGEISPAGDSDSWTFTASVGDRIVVRAGELATTAFNPWIKLFNPTGTQISSALGNVAAEITVTATNSGTFTVTVSDASSGGNQTGGYRLTLAKTGSTNVISAGDEGGTLTNGVMHTGTIEDGALDLWTFAANAGENIAVRIGETSATAFTPWIRVYGPNGPLLSSDLGTAAAESAFTATNSGTFTVVVGDGSSGIGSAGNYRITLAKTGDPVVVSTGDEGGTLTNGVTYSGAIDVGDLDVWSVTANAGETITVRAGDSVGDAFTPWVRIYGANGPLLDSGFGASAGEATARITNGGSFIVVIGDASSGIGSPGNYRLTLAKTGSPIGISNGDEGGSLTNGVMYLGAIDTGDLDVFSFIANAGERVLVRAGDNSGNAFTPWLRIYGPDGALLDSGFGTLAAEVAATVTNSGTFTVVASDGSSGLASSGNYRLTLAKTGVPFLTSNGDEGGSMTNGLMHLGAIDVGDLDLWSVAATAGERIVLRVGDVSENAFTPYIRIYGPNGPLLDSSFGALAAEVEIAATNTGSFLVVVGDGSSGLGSAGNYRLTVAKTGSPLSVSNGDEGGPLASKATYDGEITTGDLDAFSFTACNGDPISLQLDEVGATPFTPWMRLYGPDGAALNSSFGAATASINRTAPANGTYLVVIGDGSSGIGNAGSYRLTANQLSDGLKLCLPGISGTNLNVVGIGGTPNTAFSVLTSTNITTPIDLWTPVIAGQFDAFGVFTKTTTFIGTDPKRFFLLLNP